MKFYNLRTRNKMQNFASSHMRKNAKLRSYAYFEEMGLIERYGTGVKRIRQRLLEHQLPESKIQLLQKVFFCKSKCRKGH